MCIADGQYIGRDNDSSYMRVSVINTYPSFQSKRPPLISSSIILLIVLYTSPDTSAQALILFYPKVAFLCIAATLLSRVRIVQAHIENGGGGKYASSGGSTTGMTMSEGAVFYGQDKGGLVHVSRGGEGDEKKAAERGRGKEVKTAGTVMSAALTESTIEPEDAWRGSQV